jgi:putative transposase
METTLNRASHAVYNIQLHIVLVTKYHKDVINQAILGKLQEVLDRVCSKRKSKLLEFSGEENHTPRQ